MRVHVAGAAGIVVDQPGAAQIGLALQHQEIAAALLPQLDGHAQPGEAGADDHDFVPLYKLAHFVQRAEGGET